MESASQDEQNVGRAHLADLEDVPDVRLTNLPRR